MGDDSALSLIQSIVTPAQMTEIVRCLGGERVYIPSKMPLDSQGVCDEFVTILHDGSTAMSAYQQIADAHHVSPRTIMRTIIGSQHLTVLP